MLVPLAGASPARTLEPQIEENARDGWEELTPRREWRTMSSRTDEASEVLGRIMNTHEAAVRQPFGPKQYQPGTSSDEEANEDELKDDVGETPKLHVVMSEDPRQTESLVALSRSSSSNVLHLPTRSSAPAAPSEEDIRFAEQKELEELELENERLREAVATALQEEKARNERRSDKAAFRRMERIYASAELEPESQLPASSATVHVALAHAGEMGVRLKAAGARVGHVTCSLMWSNTDDLDLHCESEPGGHISWNKKKGKCGGHLDVDMNASDHHLQERPVENIVWDSAPPAGTYRIWVENNTARNGGPTPFVVRLTMDGKSQDKEFDDVRELESVDVFNFEAVRPESPEPQKARDGGTDGTLHEGSPTPHLLFMLRERERVMHEQAEEIKKLRQQIAMQELATKAAHMPGAPSDTTAVKEKSEYSADIRGMSSAYQTGVAPGGSLSELQESGSTFAVSSPPPIKQ